MDLIAEGYEIPLVIEVVSTKYKANREKDEVDNVAIYDRLGVHDYVMVYPRFEERGESLRLKAKTRGLRRSFIDNHPIVPLRGNVASPQGRIRIHSLDFWIYVDEKGSLALEDAVTGKRIWFHVDEHRLRLAAEQRAEEEAEARRKEAEARRDADRRVAPHQALRRGDGDGRHGRLSRPLPRLAPPGGAEDLPPCLRAVGDAVHAGGRAADP